MEEKYEPEIGDHVYHRVREEFGEVVGFGDDHYSTLVDFYGTGCEEVSTHFLMKVPAR